MEIISIRLINVYTKSKRLKRNRRGIWYFSIVVKETDTEVEYQIKFSPQKNTYHIENAIDQGKVYGAFDTNLSPYDEWIAQNNCLTLAIRGENELDDNYIKESVLDKMKERLKRLMTNREHWQSNNKGLFQTDASFGRFTITLLGKI